MDHDFQLRVFLGSLQSAHSLLYRKAKAHPVLAAPARAFRRIVRELQRPLRLAILGESNSGKSSVANILTGGMTLPALPVANTRLPTLLKYTPAPFAEALYVSGERCALSASSLVRPGEILRLEVGFPSELLRFTEILDFPGSANPLFPTAVSAVLRHGIHAAVWTTPATQAWRESERLIWLGLPPRIRAFGLLAITHCDLISSARDFSRLTARLDAVAAAHFRGVGYIAAGGGNAAVLSELTGAEGLVAQIRQMSRQFANERFGKAQNLVRQIAGNTLLRLETSAVSPLG